jgi:ABC-2 type transport system ATP-binding protein
MDDIEAICSRVILIAGGRIACDGSLADLRAAVGNERWLTVDLLDEKQELSDPDASLVKRDGGRVTLAFDPRKVPVTELIARIAASHPVRDLFVGEPPIEQVVARVYETTHNVVAASGGRA